MSAKQKKKTLTLEEKVNALALYEKLQSSRKVALEIGVGKDQIQRLVKRKAEIQSEFEQNVMGERKRKRRKTGNEDVNDLTWDWFRDVTSRKINVNGPLIKAQALKFAKELGNSTFTASNGWLESFHKRHNIVFSTMNGESGDVDDNVIAEWVKKLPQICSGYEPCNIFNMDETGLFFRQNSSKTFHVKGDDCSGGKRSKDRVTVSLCASMTGEKVTPVIIWKSKNPRCFKNIPIKSLPVQYFSNKKAWMTSVIFEQWLKTFDAKMKRLGRKVLLLLDNAPSHPKVTFSNVKLCFLPANTTSKSQPMDQGIIQTLKLKYRKRQLEYVLDEMERDKTAQGSSILKKISILDAIYWISRSWREVEISTIQKCFKLAGLTYNSLLCEGATPTPTEQREDSDDESEDNLPLAVLQMSRELFDCDFKDLLQLDRELQTCDRYTNWEKPATDLLEERQEKIEETHDSDSDCDKCADNESSKVCSLSEAQKMISQLKAFALHSGKIDFLNYVVTLEDISVNMRLDVTVKQTSIDSFFSRIDSK